jgi:hypothetical protein
MAGQVVSKFGLWENDLVAAPNVDQFGEELTVLEGVATGTTSMGVSSLDAPPFSRRVTVGSNDNVYSGAWLDDDDRENAQLLHFYALSAPIIAVPEPQCEWLLAVIGAICIPRYLDLINSRKKD